MFQARRPLSLVGIFILTGFPPLHGLAQENDARLEEVIVTAQKREQKLLDVPMAISALSRDFIEKNELNNLEDLSKAVPSVRITRNGTPSGGGSIHVRGVGTQVLTNSVEPNVLVMLDEVPLANNSLANFDFIDVERIEVLRGPQGTLFGKNASAGLVHVITRDPAQEFEARTRASFEKVQDAPGSLSKFQGSVSGPITDSIGVRVTGFYSQVRGHLEDIRQNEEIPDADRFGIRSKLRWDPTDVLSLKLNLEYSRTDGDFAGVVFRSGNPDHQRRSNIEFSEENRKTKTFGTLADREGHAASLIVNWEIGDSLLTSVTGYRKSDSVNDVTLADLNGARGQLKRTFGVSNLETITQEFRLTSQIGDNIDYSTGILWFDNEIGNEGELIVDDLPAALLFGAGVLPPGAPEIPASLTDQLNALGGADAVDLYQEGFSTVGAQNLGIYFEATWRFAESWRLTAGARYIDEEVFVRDLYERQIISHTDSGVAIIDNQFTSAGESVSDQAATGRLSMQYYFEENSNVFATISTGYRGRAFDLTLAPDTQQTALDNPIDPEKATSYELGYKTRLFDSRLDLSIGAFLTVFKDFQAQVRDLTNEASLVSFRIDNAGELETRGLELEFHAKPTASLLFIGSFLYNIAEYNEFVTQCFIGMRADEDGAIDQDRDGVCDAQDVSGKPLANAPKLSGSITGRYTHTLESSGHMLYGQLSGRYQDEVQYSNDQHPLTITDPFSIWDMRLGWLAPGERMELAFYVKNLFDKTYGARLVPLSIENDRRDVTQNVPRDAARQFGLSMQYRW